MWKFHNTVKKKKKNSCGSSENCVTEGKNAGWQHTVFFVSSETVVEPETCHFKCFPQNQALSVVVVVVMGEGSISKNYSLATACF